MPDPDTEARNLIEQAHRVGEALGLAVWNEDEAGLYQTVPHPGAGWRPVGAVAHRPHENVRNSTAELLTLFHPASGAVRQAGEQADQPTRAVRLSTPGQPSRWRPSRQATSPALVRSWRLLARPPLPLAR